MNTAFTMSCLTAGVMAMNLQQATHKSVTLAQKPTFGTYETQALAQISSYSCLTTAKRNKSQDLPDFYNLVKGSSQYKDTDFTPDASSISWSGFNEKNPIAGK